MDLDGVGDCDFDFDLVYVEVNNLKHKKHAMQRNRMDKYNGHLIDRGSITMVDITLNSQPKSLTLLRPRLIQVPRWPLYCPIYKYQLLGVLNDFLSF